MWRSSAGRYSGWNSFPPSLSLLSVRKANSGACWGKYPENSFNPFPILFATNVNRPLRCNMLPEPLPFEACSISMTGHLVARLPDGRLVLESGGIDPRIASTSNSNTTVKSKLHTNDAVWFSGEIWRVVTTINGNKADLQRLHSSNPRIITVSVDSLHVEVVQRFGSPNSSF